MSIKRQAAVGAKWLGAGSAITAVLQIVQITVLARLLRPEDFGLMAMVMVVAGFAQAYSDMGISNAIIHRQDTTKNQLSSLYWLNVIAGTTVFAIFAISAPLVSWFFEEPRVMELMFWIAPLFLLTPFGQQFQILLQKQLNFKTLAVIEISSAIVGMLTGISFALAGQGVHSLIWGHLASAALSSFILLYVGWREWRPQFRFRREDLRGYLSFGLYQMGERSINYFNSKIDQLLIGAILTATALGYYNFAIGLVMIPVMRVNPVVTRVTFPVFAKLQHDDTQLKRGYLMTLRILSQLNFPFFFGLFVMAPWLIPIVFSDTWAPAVIIIQILSFGALLRSIINPVGSLLLAKGRADLGFKWNTILLCTQGIGIYIGAQFAGTTGVAVSLVILQTLYFVASYFALIRVLLGPCLYDYITNIAPPFILAGTMSIAIALLMSYLEQPTVLALIGTVGVGTILYLGLFFLFQRRQFMEIMDLVFARQATGAEGLPFSPSPRLPRSPEA